MREGKWVDSGAYGARTIRRGMALRPRSPRWKGGLPWKDLRWIRAIGAEPPAFP